MRTILRQPALSWVQSTTCRGAALRGLFGGGVVAIAIGLSSTVGLAAPSTPTPSVGPSNPPSAEAKKKAMEHFETGLRLYEDGDFSLALIEFDRAYSHVPDYRVLYNIGQVSIQLGRYARAAQALTQYLKTGGDNIASARRKSVGDDLKMLEGRTARIIVECNVAGAEVLLDDVLLAKTPASESLLVDAGEHRLTVQKDGYVPRTERLILAGRDENRLEINLSEVHKSAPTPPAAIAHPQLPPPPPIRGDEPTRPISRHNQLLYVGAGATGLLAVGWALTGYVGVKAAGDLHSALQRPTNQGELDTLKGKAKGWLLASDILGAAALTTGVTTLYFALKGPPKEQPPGGMNRVGLVVSPGAVGVAGTFH